MQCLRDKRLRADMWLLCSSSKGLKSFGNWTGFNWINRLSVIICQMLLSVGQQLISEFLLLHQSKGVFTKASRSKSDARGTTTRFCSHMVRPACSCPPPNCHSLSSELWLTKKMRPWLYALKSVSREWFMTSNMLRLGIILLIFISCYRALGNK